MALLTAEDVLNKTFPATKFREGYDQDEVDDFLDEVVNTIRALTAENDDLKAKLAEYESGGTPAPAEQDDATTDVEAEPQPEPEQVAEPVAQQPEAPVAGQQQNQSEPEAATGMLALAAKLHDEYVSGGRAEGERLLSEAQSKAHGIVKEAEETSARTLSQLEQERSLLERKIDELRIFERDYRSRLRTYLENLLGDLENRGSAIPNSPIPGQP